MYTSFHSKFDDNSQDLSQNEYGYHILDLNQSDAN